MHTPRPRSLAGTQEGRLRPELVVIPAEGGDGAVWGVPRLDRSGCRGAGEP
jgi:hypothetical protein